MRAERKVVRGKREESAKWVRGEERRAGGTLQLSLSFPDVL